MVVDYDTGQVIDYDYCELNGNCPFEEIAKKNCEFYSPPHYRKSYRNYLEF